MILSQVRVALRKESVDRNLCLIFPLSPRSLSLSARRAWIEIVHDSKLEKNIQSLSARRAWIEIAVQELIPLADPVALRKESVDRNALSLLTYHLKFGVALRKESVDRNIQVKNTPKARESRSPQGERG